MGRTAFFLVTAFAFACLYKMLVLNVSNSGRTIGSEVYQLADVVLKRENHHIRFVKKDYSLIDSEFTSGEVTCESQVSYLYGVHIQKVQGEYLTFEPFMYEPIVKHEAITKNEGILYGDFPDNFYTNLDSLALSYAPPADLRFVARSFIDTMRVLAPQVICLQTKNKN